MLTYILLAPIARGLYDARMKVTAEQLEQVRDWAAQGIDLNGIQKRLASECGVHLTYMDVRFLLLDNGIEIAAAPEPEKKPEPKKDLAIGAVWNGEALGMDGGKYDTTIHDGDAEQLLVLGTDSDVVWSSSDESKVTVSSDGTVKRIADGQVTITATVDGQTLTCIVRD